MTSAKFTPVPATRINTWPGPGVGSGISWYSSTSGPPKALMTTAFMVPPFLRSPTDPDPSGARCQRKHRLDLDREPARQLEHPDGGPSMRPLLAPEGEVEV